MKKHHIMAPGPTSIPPSILSAAGMQILHHRTPEFRAILKEVSDNLKKIFLTNETVLVFSAGATGGMEACIINLTEPGDTILAITGGVFGERWAKIAESHQRKVIRLDIPWGTAVQPHQVAQVLREHPEISVVACTLCETSTGVEHPIKELAQIVKASKALMLVDVVSALGVSEFRMDEWDIDAAIAGTQKGLMCPPGLSLIALSKKAKEVMKQKRSPKFFWSFENALKSAEAESTPDTPFTPSISLIIQLNVSLNLILNEGLENVWKRHQIMAAATRAGIIGMGLELFVKDAPSPTVTTILAPENIPGTEIVKKMRNEWSISLVAGQGKLKNQIFRIGHIGFCDLKDILMTIAVLEIVLRGLGYPLLLGEGVQAVQSYLFGIKSEVHHV